VLPLYALFSVARILTAYLISLIFAIAYGQFAAHNARAERILIPLLDTLQSIPVLSFLPPVMVAMVALFPTRQFGVELGSILLIFTGQVWNMAFEGIARSRRCVPPELVAALHPTGTALFGHRAGVELHDVGGRRVVFPDGMRGLPAQ
jgi:NitT/TauT family transport system permease protein